MVHFFVVRQQKAGQKEIPDLKGDVVLESAFDMDFKPGGKAGQRTTLKIDDARCLPDPGRDAQHAERPRTLLRHRPGCREGDEALRPASPGSPRIPQVERIYRAPRNRDSLAIGSRRPSAAPIEWLLPGRTPPSAGRTDFRSLSRRGGTGCDLDTQANRSGRLPWIGAAAAAC